jgi:hypothetical protein
MALLLLEETAISKVIEYLVILLQGGTAVFCTVNLFELRITERRLVIKNNL